MQRVMICGGPGSGKSTLARILGERTGLPVYHMDHIHYAAGWVPRPTEDKDRMSCDIHRRESWIFEGGHSRTYADRVAHADTFIWLDLPVGLRFARVIWRTLRDYGKTRPDMAPDCPEGFHAETLPFWRWIWRTRHASRIKLARIADQPGHLTVYHLQSRSQVRQFIANLPKTKEPANDPCPACD
ncbi:AAA family ATPase [Loktanella agnita]|uniref:AAA family ATPase n=1 Tax=Loktanella agnita TaxID=287097 RepID=UPI0039864F21